MRGGCRWLLKPLHSDQGKPIQRKTRSVCTGEDFCVPRHEVARGLLVTTLHGHWDGHQLPMLPAPGEGSHRCGPRVHTHVQHVLPGQGDVQGHGGTYLKDTFVLWEGNAKPEPRRPHA